jgi:hypothetical protein
MWLAMGGTVINCDGVRTFYYEKVKRKENRPDAWGLLYGPIGYGDSYYLNFYETEEEVRQTLGRILESLASGVHVLTLSLEETEQGRTDWVEGLRPNIRLS